MALRIDGSIASWGNDQHGQVSNTPIGTGFTQVAAGNRHSVALGDYSIPRPILYCTAGTSASGCQATLSWSGTPSGTAGTGFDLIASSIEGNKVGLFCFGTSGRQANSWGSGTSFQCVTPPLKRGALLVGSGTSGACDGTFSQDFNALGLNPGAGAVVRAQLWYRDPLNTSNQTTSLSNAIEFTVGP